MSKYKNGDKFIIEIEGVHESFDNFYGLKGSGYSLPEVWFFVKQDEVFHKLKKLFQKF